MRGNRKPEIGTALLLQNPRAVRNLFKCMEMTWTRLVFGVMRALHDRYCRFGLEALELIVILGVVISVAFKPSLFGLGEAATSSRHRLEACRKGAGTSRNATCLRRRWWCDLPEPIDKSNEIEL
uniref:Uncharacterized protein n=1 Tax=Anopheles maculatus TaxID=74869 RepID=A0A182T7H3_9DIPT